MSMMRLDGAGYEVYGILIPRWRLELRRGSEKL